MKNRKILYLLLSCFIFYSFPYLISKQITTPLEVDHDYFSSLLVRERKINSEPKWDIFFDFRGFIPGDAIYNMDGQIAPHTPPGFIFLTALAKLILPDWLVFFLNPLLGCLSTLIFYKISKIILHDDRKAFYSALILATTPVFIHWTNLFFPDILNLTIFLFAFLKLLKIFEGNRQKDYLLFGLFCGFLPWIRYSSIILLFPLAVLIYLNRKKVQKPPLILSAIVTCSLILLLLLFFLHTYGSLFKTGYGDPFASASLTDPWCLFHHLINSPLSFTMAFPPLLLSILGIFAGYNRDKDKSFYVFFFILSVITIFFFARQRWYGTAVRDLTLHASYLRYLLPFFVFLPLFTIVGISNLDFKITKKLLLILLAFNLVIATFAPFGIVHTNLNKIYHKDVSDFIIGHTDKKTVIVSSYWRHIVFPKRIAFTWTRRLIAEREVLELTDKILEKGYSFCYVYNDEDKEIAHILEPRYKVRMISGPEKLSPILKFVPIPKHIYPLHLYLLKKDN